MKKFLAGVVFASIAVVVYFSALTASGKISIFISNKGVRKITNTNL